MADFWKAWELTKENEGGYSNNPNDIGGETYRGISRKYNPSWSGWNLIDQVQPDTNYSNNILDSEAADYYKNIYWSGTLCGLLKYQDTANVIFDCAVSSGVARTNDFVKDILNKHFNASFTLDGTTNINVINALNKIPSDDFITWLNTYRKKFYLFSAAALSRFDSLYPLLKKYNTASEEKRARQQIFLSAWLKRVNRYGKQKTNYALIAGVCFVSALVLVHHD